MKATVILLTAALLSPAALSFGLSAALVSTVAVGIGLSSIVINDYGDTATSYHVATSARPAERHALAA